MNYILNKKVLQERLLKLGFRSLSEFASKNKIHRNTLQNLLSGKSVFCASFQKIVSSLELDPLELIVPSSTTSHAPLKKMDELKTIIAHLVQANEKMAIVLIGSRAKGKEKKYSDWDLGIFGYPEPILDRAYLKLKGLVDEMSENLVWIVDLVNLNRAPIWFLENLDNKVIFLDGNQEAFAYLKGILDGIEKEKAA
ncbi:MAG: nucleotidyltransferase domain-containing protein [Deltaproteobacteria bacterium]|nr:nucleotidyltransferase domain-containing protein [Deltaproteobacteria bacterium]